MDDIHIPILTVENSEGLDDLNLDGGLCYAWVSLPDHATSWTPGGSPTGASVSGLGDGLPADIYWCDVLPLS